MVRQRIGLFEKTSSGDLLYEDILKRTGNEAEAVFQAMEVLNFTRKGKNPLMQFCKVQ